MWFGWRPQAAAAATVRGRTKIDAHIPYYVPHLIESYLADHSAAAVSLMVARIVSRLASATSTEPWSFLGVQVRSAQSAKLGNPAGPINRSDLYSWPCVARINRLHPILGIQWAHPLPVLPVSDGVRNRLWCPVRACPYHGTVKRSEVRSGVEKVSCGSGWLEIFPCQRRSGYQMVVAMRASHESQPDVDGRINFSAFKGSQPARSTGVSAPLETISQDCHVKGGRIQILQASTPRVQGGGRQPSRG